MSQENQKALQNFYNILKYKQQKNILNDIWNSPKPFSSQNVTSNKPQNSVNQPFSAETYLSPK